MSVREKMALIRFIMRFQLIKVDGDRIFSILKKKRIAYQVNNTLEEEGLSLPRCTI